MGYFGIPIRNGLPIGLGSLVGFGIRSFDPSELFAAGEQGTWYDPSDFSTLFQDSAGTTPVTGVEQVVGRMLDKSGRGNHATATGSARPTLSARVNLLTKTEQFENAAWTKSNVTATADAAVAPNGTLTADKIASSVSTSVQHVVSQAVARPSLQQTLSVYAKAAENQFLWLSIYDSTHRITWFNLSAGTIGTNAAGSTATIVDQGNGWYLCSITRTTDASASPEAIIGFSNANNVAVYADTIGNGIYIWGADLRVTNDGVGIPAYQRVNTSTDYATAGFPVYLAFGGAQAMSTPANVDFSGTDKMTVFAGVRKLSDAAAAMIAELSTSVSTGAFDLQGPASAGGATYRFRAGGTTIVSALSPSSYAAPISNVLTAQNNVGAPSISLRVNGSEVVSNISSQGTGNYGSYPLFIGARNLAAVFLTGRLYSLITRGAATDSASVAATEAWVNQRTAAY